MAPCPDQVLCNRNAADLPGSLGYFLVDAGRFAGDCAHFGSQVTEVARRTRGGCLSCEGVGAPYSTTTTGPDAAGTSRIVGAGCYTQQSCLTGADSWCALDVHCGVFSADPYRAALRKWQRGEDSFQLPGACPRTTACCRALRTQSGIIAGRCYDEIPAECLLNHGAGSRTIQGPYGPLTQTWEAREAGVSHPVNTQCACRAGTLDTPQNPDRYTRCLGQRALEPPVGGECNPHGACCRNGACNVVRFDQCNANGGSWEGKPNCVGVTCLEACCLCGSCSNISKAECATLGGRNFPNKKCVDVALTDDCRNSRPGCKDAVFVGFADDDASMVPVSRRRIRSWDYPPNNIDDCRYQQARANPQANGDFDITLCNRWVDGGDRRIRSGDAEPLSVPQDDMAFVVRYIPACPPLN